jgi:diguanylate cyclase (GGDEF)-like protein
MLDLRVLLVEDDKAFQSNMKIFFDGLIKELYQAYDGEEGIEAFKKYNPDIVITDIEMPKKDGLTMAKEIKAIKDVPIIIMSAYDDKEYMLDAINNIGVNGFVVKPINVMDLFNRLDNIASSLSEDKKFKNLAYIDFLTGLYNRRAFDKKIEDLINENKRFALFFIDLDDFKSVNDMYGHSIGDDLLKFVASSIKDIVRKDDFIARVGGDEFVLIIEDIDKEAAEDLAFSIINSIKRGINTIKGNVKVGCSIGVSFYPENNTKDKLINSADKAMYSIKKDGKSGVLVS